MTDEDEQIARLEIHRGLIGWVIAELHKEGIRAKKTTESSPKGDFLIVDREEVARVKQLLHSGQSKFKILTIKNRKK